MEQNIVLIIQPQMFIFKYFLLPSIITINAISEPIIVKYVASVVKLSCVIPHM